MLSRWNKKAQLTVFMLIVVVILLGFGAYWAVQSFKVDQLEDEAQVLVDVPKAVKPIAVFVQECIKQVSLPVLELIGLQGGYIELPELKLKTADNELAYGYYEGENVLVDKEKLEEQLAGFMDIAIDECANLSNFEKQGFVIEKGEVNTFSTVGKDKVTHRVEFPLKITKEENVNEIKDFRYEINIRLGEMHEAAGLIVDKIIFNPDTIDLTYLDQFDFNISIIPADINNLIYSLVDEKVRIGNKPYVFMFGAGYEVNKPPQILMNDKYTLEDGVEFTLQINAIDPENDVLEFSDNTALFDITQTGLIQFTPEIPGEYDVVITVKDVKDNVVKKKVKFVVNEKYRKILVDNS